MVLECILQVHYIISFKKKKKKKNKKKKKKKNKKKKKKKNKKKKKKKNKKKKKKKNKKRTKEKKRPREYKVYLEQKKHYQNQYSFYNSEDFQKIPNKKPNNRILQYPDQKTKRD
eukprot:TRINITY_DN806_c0_g1_i1.p6 TRINITY_DN806_c0_g1~~TRINITY_DN806_c0_g1_i1.p6  ORF type:complete len:114 (+),score=32.69 TRINITY_DN806_c0_g1_i1:1141-1482(+)